MPPHGSSPRKDASRRYYEKHKAEILAKRKARRDSGQARETTRQRIVRHRNRAQALKAAPCLDCGVAYPPYVMDFDHVRGEKIASVASLIWNDASWDVIEAEIAKCEVVCSNCHRERTHQRLAADCETL